MNKSVLQRGIIFVLCICLLFQSVRFMLLQQKIRKRKLSGLVCRMIHVTIPLEIDHNAEKEQQKKRKSRICRVRVYY